MKYSKLFNNHSNYNDYITGQDKVLPNVSYCRNENEVHYNPIETRLVAKYNVTSTSEPTRIISSNATSTFSEIEIDGVVQPSVVSSYTFDTTGEHTVKYTLADPTSIGETAFYYCTGLTSITIPNSVTTIGDNAFSYCSELTSLLIGSGIINVGDEVVYYCRKLTNITIKAVTPPTIVRDSFQTPRPQSIIYVPEESLNLYKEQWTAYTEYLQAIQ